MAEGERSTTNNAFAKASTAKSEAGTVAAKTSVQTVAAANPNRVELFVSNDGAEAVYLALGSTAVAHKGIRLPKESGPYVITGYTGVVTAITVTAEVILCVAEV